MQAAILEFCNDRYRTPQEIAQALRRGAKTLKSNYLPHLIAAGLLEPLYPDSPTHPQQAYRTKKEPA
jgi:ATP-dependent DNA helicase RecG